MYTGRYEAEQSMESETHHDFDNEEKYWQELETTISKHCETHSAIDETLRSYLSLTTAHSDYIESKYHLRRCAYILYSSKLFGDHTDYIRRQFVHCLLQDEETSVLQITTTFLLADARENEQTFELLNEESVFPRLVELITAPREDGEEMLHRQLMELLYEMSRIQKIKNHDLTSVTDDFISRLFDIIEDVSGNVDDPYHYPVIRVLLVLNEQFMVAAHDPSAAAPNTAPITNKVMKVLSAHGSRYKTFGENIILLLNREDETSLQLLTLKLLYLLFTTPPTYEYFYTNDLHVLVDILVRNLLDLPEEASSLRHTYLRVLYPLLEHTQLKEPPHYKRDEVRKLLSVLAGGQMMHDPSNVYSVNHFEAVDDTTKRLVNRCRGVSWLKEPTPDDILIESPTESTGSPVKLAPPALPAPRKLRKRNTSKAPDSVHGPYLTAHSESARQSSLSMAEVASQREKPGVITPSRNPSVKHGLREAVMRKKERPPPPVARRSAWARIREQKSTPIQDPFKAEPSEEAPEAVEDSSSEQAQTQVSEEVKPVNRPPPAPKARKWRRGRSKDEDEVAVRSKEPGKFNANLPSLSLPTSNPTIAEQSPFSPPEEKTLSPMSKIDDSSNVTSKKAKRISSVSAALSQAQAQALSDLGRTLEDATIVEECNPFGEAEQNIIEQPKSLTSPTLQHRTVLAPPSQAPIRGVPGPKMELERSPFLSDTEDIEAEAELQADKANNADTAAQIVAEDEAAIDTAIINELQDMKIRMKAKRLEGRRGNNVGIVNDDNDDDSNSDDHDVVIKNEEEVVDDDDDEDEDEWN